MAEINVTGLKAFTAGEALEAYRRVKLNSSQEVVYADADDIGIGITEDAAASAGVVTVRLHNAPGTRKVVCAAAVDIGDILYGADDGKVNDIVTVGPAMYEALAAGSADLSVIEVIPLGARATGSKLLYSNQANSADHENTTDEAAFDKSKTIDGASLRVGDVLEVVAQANVLDNNSTDTLTLRLKVGSEEIIATAAVDVADGDIGYIHAFIAVRALGASGAIAACGVQGLGVPGTVTAKPFFKSEAAEDLSGDVAITVTADWSVAHADNEVFLENLIVIHHRQ